jgi:small subunit ribosomal protein S4
MTKRIKAKHKVDRRLKVNLWGKPKSPFNTRNYPPGQHGQSKKGKPTDYGVQLNAKQKLKSYYGNINERQFRNVYRKAIKKKGNTTENLVGILERRLDTVISSYLVKEEDLIELKDKSKSLSIIETCLNSKERDVPEYIQLDTKNKTAKLVRVPKFADIPYPTLMEPKLVIEYYSR